MMTPLLYHKSTTTTTTAVRVGVEGRVRGLQHNDRAAEMGKDKKKNEVRVRTDVLKNTMACLFDR